MSNSNQNEELEVYVKVGEQEPIKVKPTNYRWTSLNDPTYQKSKNRIVTNKID